MGNKGLTIAPIICDGMILQRDTKNKIYGKEMIADSVTISFMDKTYSTKVNDKYNFCIELPPVAAGGPYSMTIKGSSEITISDILFGDVYILSGQSNMELPIGRVLDVSNEEVKQTHEPTIRQYLMPATFNFSEPEEFMYSGSWMKATEKDLLGFSAAGYFFAKEIKEVYNVPVGLIMTAVGGSKIESWMNSITLSKFGDYGLLVEIFKDKNYFNHYIEEQQNAANEWIHNLEMEDDKLCQGEIDKDWNTCMVPSLVLDYMDGSFQGSIYLCKEVIIDEEPTSEEAEIYLGTIIDSDRVYINGHLIGRTEYRYPPRKYKFEKGILKKGSNLIVVRMVINNSNGGTIKERPYYLKYDDKKINLSGEWYYRIGKRVDTPIPSVLFPPLLPICFYNTVVVPLSKLSVKGVLWYQGESNASDGKDYADKFTSMVNDWRELFGYNVPFIYVQLSNFREPLSSVEDTGWAWLRDQQRQSLNLDNVAMVVTLDIGEKSDLHPQNKKEVGVRLAKAARHLIYKEDIIYSGPLPNSAKLYGKNVEIEFIYLEELDIEQTINNFELAGSEGKYYDAVATRKGNKVLIYSDHIDKPVSVRYCWRDCPNDINFYNNIGLPASSFQLDI